MYKDGWWLSMDEDAPAPAVAPSADLPLRGPAVTRSKALDGQIGVLTGHDDRGVDPAPPPLGTQTTATYYGNVQNVAPGLVPRIYNRSYPISADLAVPVGGADGVIVADGNHLGGFSLFVEDGKLKHTYAFVGVFEYRQESEEVLPAGDVTVAMAFAADEAKPATPGQVTLFVDGKPVGGGRLDHTVPFGFSGYSGLDVGQDNGLVVDRGYASRAPFAYAGVVRKVVFDVDPHLEDDEHALHAQAQQASIVRGVDA